MKAKRGKIIMCLDKLGERFNAVRVRDTYGLFNSYVQYLWVDCMRSFPYSYTYFKIFVVNIYSHPIFKL